jgi:hypothetical protein
MAVHGRASNGALPFCFGIVAARPVRSYYLVTPEHRNRHPVATPTTLVIGPHRTTFCSGSTFLIVHVL